VVASEVEGLVGEGGAQGGSPIFFLFLSWGEFVLGFANVGMGVRAVFFLTIRVKVLA